MQTLRQRLDRLREDGLWRELRRVDSPQAPRIETGGRHLLNLSSNDYLGLAAHPALRAAAARAATDCGAGAGASRLICGSLAVHHDLETALARFKRTPAALSFTSGYTAALGAITSLVGPGDVVILDRLVHACIVDAARLSGAKLRVFAHNDLADLESILAWARHRSSSGTTTESQLLVVTESLFSMDGDRAPLRELVELKDRFGAWLMVDEAHATGVFGPRLRGLAEASGVADRIEVHLGTLGKALGASGGFVAGAEELIALLINRARSFVFSTAPVPAAAAAARAGLEIVAGGRFPTELVAGRESGRAGLSEPAAGCGRTEVRRAGDSPPYPRSPGEEDGAALACRLWERIGQLRDGLARLGWEVPAEPSPILPLVVGDERAAVRLAADLRAAGFLVPAIRYPTVARGGARLRVTVSAAHEAADIGRFCEALEACAPSPKS